MAIPTDEKMRLGEQTVVRIVVNGIVKYSSAVL